MEGWQGTGNAEMWHERGLSKSPQTDVRKEKAPATNRWLKGIRQTGRDWGMGGHPAGLPKNAIP
jgi:hypothetical protein